MSRIRFANGFCFSALAFALGAQSPVPKADPGKPLIIPGPVKGITDTDVWTWGSHMVRQLRGMDRWYSDADVEILAEGDEPVNNKSKPTAVFEAKDLTAAAQAAEEALKPRAASLHLPWPVAFDSIRVVGPTSRRVDYYQFIPWPTLLLVARWPGVSGAYAVFAIEARDMKVHWTGAFRADAKLDNGKFNISPSGQYLLRPAAHRLRAWRVEDLASGEVHELPAKAFKGDHSAWQEYLYEVPLWLPGDHLLQEAWQVPHGFEAPLPPTAPPPAIYGWPGSLATFDLRYY